MVRNKRRHNKKNQNNQPEVQRHSSTFHNYYRADNINVQYQYNNWENRPFHCFDNNRRFYGRYNYFAPRREREPSPLNGSEEYTQRKIQETSDMIKRQLMSPDNCLPYTPTVSKLLEEKSSDTEPNPPIENKRVRYRKKKEAQKLAKDLSVQKSHMTYNVKEIHDQIMNHISKLNYGRKQNLVNCDNSGYDEAIRQIHKQKSLELSKALRVMSHQEKPEASEIVNSIIPDFAIKFEELPIHIIRELSSSFEALDRNIGIVDENTPYDLRNQCMSEPDYSHLGITNNFDYPTFDLPSNPDGRILQVNSEGVDSILIKQENMVETRIKLEPQDIIVLPDSEEEENREHLEVKEEINLDEFRKNNYERTGEQVELDNPTMDIMTLNNHLENSIGDNVPNFPVEIENSNIPRVTSDNQLRVQIIDWGETPNELMVRNDLITSLPNFQIPNVPTNTFCINTTLGNDRTGINNDTTSVSSAPRIRINSNIFESPYNTDFYKNNLISENLEASRNHCVIQEFPEKNLCNTLNVVQEQPFEKISSVETHSESKKFNESVSNSAPNDKKSPDNQNDDKNVYISVTVKRKKTPANLKEITEMMFEFDREIEKLTRLRQSIISDLNAKPEQNEKKVQVQVKRKSNHEDNRSTKKKKTNSNQPQTRTKNTKEKTSAFSFEHYNLPDVIVICKVLVSLNVLLAGTVGGLLQYFDLGNSKTRRTVKIYSTPITCLECEYIRNEHFIFTATAEQHELTILNYNTMTVLRRIKLEDGVQAMCDQWGYFFIGGSRGYLTRFNWETNRIEYEDPISTSDKIVDLKATTEGARKILVILFSDPKGSCQIHVRDALTGLHMRIVGDFRKAECLILHLHFVIVSSVEGINMYDFCDGQFKAKLARLNGVTNLRFLGNLLLAQYSEGIYVYDFKKRERLGTVKYRKISAILILNNEVVIGTTSKSLKTLTLPEEYLKLM